MIESVNKSHLSVPFLDHRIISHSRGREVLLSGSIPSHAHISSPCPVLSGVLLCCQITKWLFACYKQRKQILYRYYIYIDMFFHWEMRIGIHIPLIPILKDNTHTQRSTVIHAYCTNIHTYTLLPTVICGKS